RTGGPAAAHGRRPSARVPPGTRPARLRRRLAAFLRAVLERPARRVDGALRHRIHRRERGRMTPMTPERSVVRLERTIPAAPHQVYRAWLDPDLLRRWLAPGGLEVARVEVEPGVGGHLRVWETDAGTDVGGFDCEILELVPDRRIVF